MEFSFDRLTADFGYLPYLGGVRHSVKSRTPWLKSRNQKSPVKPKLFCKLLHTSLP